MNPEAYHAPDNPDASLTLVAKLENGEITTLEKRAQKTVRNNEFSETIKLLSKEELEPLTEQMKQTHENLLETADFLTDRDWELLTIINLYSEDLALHCIETYYLVKSKIKTIHIKKRPLIEQIAGEVDLDKFYRASILHDIGKTLIPKSILNNTLTLSDWQTQLKEFLQNSPNDPIIKHLEIPRNQDGSLNIDLFLKNPEIHPKDILPIRLIITPEEINQLKQRGISTDLSFSEIINMHEFESQEILNTEGLPTEALIAGQHHNHRHEQYKYPTSSETIGIAAEIVDLLHLADVQNALASQRSYKPAFSFTQTSNILVQEAENDAFKSRELVAAWIQQDLEDNPSISDEEQKSPAWAHVMRFLQKYNNSLT